MYFDLTKASLFFFCFFFLCKVKMLMCYEIKPESPFSENSCINYKKSMSFQTQKRDHFLTYYNIYLSSFCY